MLVPQPGWAEHRPREDWWGDLTYLSQKLIAGSGVAPSDIKAVATSAIGPCMLPVDADGEALSNAALYGVDADVEFHPRAGHLLIVPVGKASPP